VFTSNGLGHSICSNLSIDGLKSTEPNRGSLLLFPMASRLSHNHQTTKSNFKAILFGHRHWLPSTSSFEVGKEGQGEEVSSCSDWFHLCIVAVWSSLRRKPLRATR
jgi:hypothetical protein